MTFEEWNKRREESLKEVQENIQGLMDVKQDSRLNTLLGSNFTDAITDEAREYGKTISLTFMEEDLYQIAVALNKIAETMPKAPEATSRKAEWIPKEENGKIEYYKCSVCGYGEPKTRNYCPHCGAKMKDDNDDN